MVFPLNSTSIIEIPLKIPTLALLITSNLAMNGPLTSKKAPSLLSSKSRKPPKLKTGDPFPSLMPLIKYGLRSYMLGSSPTLPLFVRGDQYGFIPKRNILNNFVNVSKAIN